MFSASRRRTLLPSRNRVINKKFGDFVVAAVYVYALDIISIQSHKIKNLSENQNKQGAIGSPCVKPLGMLNNSDRYPD